MKKRQHHPIDIKTYQKGINSDMNKELLGMRDGEHVGARNMRSVSMDGDNMAKKKIKGEQELYPNIDNRCLNGTGLPLNENYECMMTQEINGHIVEVWASPTAPVDPPLMRVDGKIVLMSNTFPVETDKDIEYHKNENCVGGEFYITRKDFTPMVFSLKDLMLNSGMTFGGETGTCTTKYFEDFDLDDFTVGVTVPLYKMKFIKQEAGATSPYDVVFGANGLAVGYYAYSYRYVTADGDRSGWSPITETIPVTQSVSANWSPQFPNQQTYSKDPNISSPSIYGNHLRLKYENDGSFDFIEVRRDGWYAGDSLFSPPVSEIVGSYTIGTGLNVINVFDYAAPDEVQEPLTVEEVSEVPEVIDGAKAVRYFNSKLYLMNVKYRSRDLNDDITLLDPAAPIFPTIEKLGKKGHSDAYNVANYKSNMRGEVHGFGLAVFDNSGSRSYATEIIDDYEFPNRRDEVSAETIGTCYTGCVRAASTDGNTGVFTHEVFDHEDAVKKDDGDIEVNLLQQTFLGADTGPYKTMTPVSQTDNSSTYGNRINKRVATRSNPTSGGRQTYYYNPVGYGLDYYSMGAAFKGIDASTLPPWADGFSVLQTNPAKRVVAQGLGYYDIIEAGKGLGPNAGKELDSIIVHFPDLDADSGLEPGIIDDLLVNVGSSSPYRIEVVSPLGFFTEVYSFFRNEVDLRCDGTDMITYCRILRDTGQMNPNWTGGVGLNGYVAFGTWRELSENPTAFPSNTNNQNGAVAHNLFTIDSVQEVNTNTGTGLNIRINLSSQLYNQAYCSADQQNFDSNPLKKWQEPIYVVNLVKDNATINQGTISEYNYTGHYVKLRSKILESDGSSTQTATLVSERWEDCLPNINGQFNNAYSSLERFVWVTDTSGNSNRWLNVDSKTPAQIATIQADIVANGFYVATDSSGSYNVYGTYTSSESVEGTGRTFTLTFNNLPLGYTVEVRYDNRIPIRVFGGDTFINDHTWAVHDNRYNKNANPIDTTHEFRFNVPFPYPAYQMVDDINILRDPTNVLTPRYQGGGFYGLHEFRFDVGFFGVGSGVNPAKIRQMIATWTAETRVNLSFSFNDEADLTSYNSQFFPQRNYIPRPYKWKEGSEDVLPPDNNNFLEENNMHEEYYDDYGQEWYNWGLGGFRFKHQTNIDYSKKQTTEVVQSIPAVGFDEENDYCTRVIWSVTRPINIQDSPTVKTFLPNSFYDISDDTGEIKFAWSADSGKGNNLYAFTESGICIPLVDKRIVHEINASELATVGSDQGGVLSELWLDKTVGMDGETWRSWAEYGNTLFWSNSVSSYMLTANQIKDLCETGYSELYRRAFVPHITDSHNMAGVYNILTKEYYVGVEGDADVNEFSTLIFGVKQDALQCESDYRYDKYLAVNNTVYGMKDMVTYRLDEGNLLDGSEYECWVAGASDKDIYYDKEFIRIRVNSPSRPKRIEFFDNYDDFVAGTPSSTVDASVNPLNIKDFWGYECYIPRKDVAPRNRQQGRVVLFKIVSEEDENFFISTTGVQFKVLK